MPGYTVIGNGRIGRLQHPGQAYQSIVLGVRVGKFVSPFQLDTDGEVVAVFPTAVARCTRMPGSPVTGDKLGNGTVTLDQKVRGHAQIGNLGKVGMKGRIKLPGKKGLNEAAAKQAGGKLML